MNYLARKKLLLLILLTISPALFAADAEEAPAGLEPIKISRLDQAYAKPGLDWGSYGAIVIAPLDMAEVTVKAPSQIHKRDLAPLSDRDKTLYIDSFKRAFNREFSQHLAVDRSSGEQPPLHSPSAIILSAKLVTLAPTYAETRRPSSAPHRVYSETSGKITMQFEIRDHASGELLAQMTDEREASRMWRENNSVQNRAQVRQIMSTWAGIFAKNLTLATKL